jgi:hypothetical protein
VDQKKAAELERILGAPFSGDLPDNAIKVRRNLLACSSVSLFLFLSGAEFDPNPIIFGFKFHQVPSKLIPIVLFFASLYFFIHFAYYAAEAFIEWRIRLTGQKVVPYTGGDILTIGDANNDGSLDPRQSTLYSWWFNHKSHFKALSDQIDETLRKYDKDRIGCESHGTEAPENTAAEIAKLEDIVKKLSAASDTMARFTPRLSESLKRFDDWVGLSLRVQSIRWITLDLIFPLSVGSASLILLFHRVFLTV